MDQPNTEEAAPKRGPGRPRTRPVRPIDYLKGLTMTDREAVAQWLDAMQWGQERELEQIASLAMQGVSGPTLSGQASYSRIKVGVLKELAWIMRTAAGGPLAPCSKKRK